MYDGILQNEREKESFYLESILRKINDDAKIQFDPIKECRFVKTLAMARKCLNDWGEKNNEPRSLISVDEDSITCMVDVVPMRILKRVANNHGLIDHYS